jgi:hypothetical protein
MKGTDKFSDLHQIEIKSDMASSENLREAAVEWGLVSSIQDTNPFAHSGYKLASRLIKQDRAVIDALTELLFERRSIDEPTLVAWFDQNAPAYPLEKLETSDTF